MSLIRCPNGHFYQPERHEVCPYCEKTSEQKPDVRLPERFAQLGRITRLGQGATSTVWRIQGETELALKQIHCGENAALREHALHEIRIMERLQGLPGVMPLLDYDATDASSVWVLMPCITTFSQRIADEDYTETDAFRMIMDVCDALETCEKHGVLHLDVQPKNLYVDANGRTLLGDFGTALLTEEAAQLHTARGTLAYMAPEVYRTGSVSLQSDLYSLGLVLYGLFNDRKLPFMSGSGNEEAAVYKRLAGTDLPICEAAIDAGDPGEQLMAVIRRMCAFRPEDRYADPASCKAALAELLQTIEALYEELENDPPESEEEYGCPGLSSAGPAGSESSYFTGSAAASFDADQIALTLAGPESFTDHCSETGYSAPSAAPSFDADQLALTVPETGGFTTRQEDHVAGFDRPQETRFDADALAITAACTDAPEVRQSPTAAPSADECRVCGQSLQQGAVFCPFCGSRQKLLQPSLPISSVQFSAIAPKSLVKGEYSMIHIMMYEEAFRHAVEEVIREAEGPVSETKSGTVRTRLGARVMIRLTSPDLTIEDNEEEREWAGDYLQFSFAVMLPEDFSKKQVLFTAQVYLDGVIATRLKFTARCFSLREQKLEVLRSDVLSAFVSYASKDRARVASIIQGMQKARPDMDIFFDVESLRSGADWESTLYSEIERRDVLYLCWSHNSRASLWVKREWEHAYETKGIDSIEPIPLEPPDECPPPPKLAGKHFNDRCLYLIRALEQHEGSGQT